MFIYHILRLLIITTTVLITIIKYHHTSSNIKLKIGNLEIKNIHAKFNASAIVKLRVADESKLLTQKGMKLTNDLACYQIEESAQFFCKNQMCIMEVEVSRVDICSIRISTVSGVSEYLSIIFVVLALLSLSLYLQYLLIFL